jgi:hypothetical protein
VKRLRGALRSSRAHLPSPRAHPCPVPPPPASLPAAERKVWRELAPQVAPVYCATDYTALRLTVKVVALAMGAGDEMPATARVRLLTTASACLSRFGLDPASRLRVAPTAPPNADRDEAAAFIFGSGLQVVPGARGGAGAEGA